MRITKEHLVGLERYAAYNEFSQTGEDGILKHLFACLEIEHGYLVDIGAGDGYNLSNVRALLNAGWTGLLIDGAGHHQGVELEIISDENVNDVMDKYNVPEEFDLLSLDIDGQDWWVWRALNRRPKVIVAEANGCIPASPAVTVPKGPPRAHDATMYYGASFSAFVDLGRAKGYTIVHNRLSLNLFFIRNDQLEPGLSIDVPYKRTNGHPPDMQYRPWHHVVEADLVDLQGITA